MSRAAFACLLAGLLLATVAIRYAEPVLDGDLFWHMAYAKQMLAGGTLVPDHSAFSWTPASNATIYCTWAADLLLFFLWKASGFAGLFALRYAVILAVLLLLWGSARREGLAREPLTYLVLFVVAVLSRPASIIKPELFSLLFLHLTLWAFFRARRIRQEGGDPKRLFFVVPLLLALWVNVHGGFILVAPFLALAAVGEELNAKFSPGLAFQNQDLRSMRIAWLLCGAAVFLTPYGWRYPAQLVGDFVFRRTARPDAAWNTAHQQIALTKEFAPLFFLMAGLLLFLLAARWLESEKGARVDFTLVLVNLAYVPLFLMIIRTTFLWPAVLGYTAISLLGSSRRFREAHDLSPPLWESRAGDTVALALCLWLGFGTWANAWRRPERGSWLGFGISNVNPVVEAEFLAAHALGGRIYNNFNSGGYLLWRLGPSVKVMVDSRSFPYLAWFEDQYRFTMGEVFDEFLTKYPGDAAVIDLTNPACIRNFLESPDWRLTFYGPTSAVFRRASVPEPTGARNFAPDRFRNLKSAASAMDVFDFASKLGDSPTALSVLKQLEGPLRHQIDDEELRTRVAWREAREAGRKQEGPAN